MGFISASLVLDGGHTYQCIDLITVTEGHEDTREKSERGRGERGSCSERCIVEQVQRCGKY